MIYTVSPMWGSIDNKKVSTADFKTGYFSSCSVKLHMIIQYIVRNKEIPEEIDSSKLFSLYKPLKSTEDVTFEYFERPENIDLTIDSTVPIDYDQDFQFSNYNTIDFEHICPVVKKYFTPSLQIKNIIQNMEEKYNIDYENTCVLFFRGNDKVKETDICEPVNYIEVANQILRMNPNTKFLIQSDTTEFIDLMLETYPNNSFYFKDETRSINFAPTTSVDYLDKKNNFMYSKYFLAITNIMAKCKYVICGSGNCSLWIMFYRGHCKNTIQQLKNEFIVHQ